MIPKLLGGPLTAYWFGGIIIAAVAIVVVWITAVQNPNASQKGLRRYLVVLSVLLILVTTAFMGFTRERSRKPYLVYGVMYGNETLAAAAATRTGTASPAASPGAAAAGRPLFAQKCAICHSLNGGGGTVGRRRMMSVSRTVRTSWRRCCRGCAVCPALLAAWHATVSRNTRGSTTTPASRCNCITRRASASAWGRRLHHPAAQQGADGP